MSDIKVSVIIPVYNVEKYLRQCLDSVVNQTLKDIEIICVNDGSTDNSLRILEEYAQKDNRIRIINKSNSGMSSARNMGLEIAKGDFIGFLDSDDYLDLNFYESLYNRAIETNSDIVICENIFRFNNNSKKNKIFLHMDKNIITSDIKEKYECTYHPFFTYVWNKIYRRSCLKERFQEGLTYEDIYFTTDVLFNSNRIAIASQVAYYYRNNPKSVVNDKSNKNSYCYHRAMAYFYKFIFDHKIDIDIQNYWGSKIYKILGFRFLKIRKDCFKTKYNIMNLIRFTLPKIKPNRGV